MCKVRLGDSRIPGAGRGVFAARDIAAGEIATWYGGRWVNVRKPKAHPRSFVYTYESVDGRILDGDRSPNDRHNLAQLCNDAIHPKVTGFSNNCEFTETKRHRVGVMAMRDIRAGEELLVSYSIGYWLTTGRRSLEGKKISRGMRWWLRMTRKVADVIKRAAGDLTLMECISVRKQTYLVQHPAGPLVICGCKKDKQSWMIRVEQENMCICMACREAIRHPPEAQAETQAEADPM